MKTTGFLLSVLFLLSAASAATTSSSTTSSSTKSSSSKTSSATSKSSSASSSKTTSTITSTISVTTTTTSTISSTSTATPTRARCNVPKINRNSLRGSFNIVLQATNATDIDGHTLALLHTDDHIQVNWRNNRWFRRPPKIDVPVVKKSLRGKSQFFQLQRGVLAVPRGGNKALVRTNNKNLLNLFFSSKTPVRGSSVAGFAAKYGCNAKGRRQTEIYVPRSGGLCVAKGVGGKLELYVKVRGARRAKCVDVVAVAAGVR